MKSNANRFTALKELSFRQKSNMLRRPSFPSPLHCLQNINLLLAAPQKAAFIAAVLVGLSAHLYQFTNKLYNYDELRNTPGGYGLTTELGRWFLELCSKIINHIFYGNYSLPLFNGLLSLLLLAISAAMVVSVFQLKNTLSAALAGALMAVFPTVTCTYFFMFTAALYMFGNFMSIFAAYLAVKFPRRISAHLTAILLIACSLGTYQAYFSNTVCIFLIVLILKSAFSKDDTSEKHIFFTALRYLMILITGLLTYFAANRYFLKAWQVEASGYQGISTMGQLHPKEFAISVFSCYKMFMSLFSENALGCTPTLLLRKCLSAICFILLCSILIILLQRKNLIKKFFTVLGIALLPAALFLIRIMAPNSWIYTIMLYSVVFLPVFCLCWSHHFCKTDGCYFIKFLTQWIVTLSCIMMTGIYIWYANANYMELEYTKYHDFSYAQTLITQIKDLPGYSDELPVVLIGYHQYPDDTASVLKTTVGAADLPGKTSSNLNDGLLFHIMYYLGFSPEFGGYAETQKWMDQTIVKEMPSYPDDGSVQIIDETVIVKLSDYE